MKNTDIITYPSKSYYLIEGKLTKANGAAYANTDKVTLINDGIKHLFSCIKYQLASKNAS